MGTNGLPWPLPSHWPKGRSRHKLRASRARLLAPASLRAPQPSLLLNSECGEGLPVCHPRQQTPVGAQPHIPRNGSLSPAPGRPRGATSAWETPRNEATSCPLRSPSLGPSCQQQRGLVSGQRFPVPGRGVSRAWPASSLRLEVSAAIVPHHTEAWGPRRRGTSPSCPCPKARAEAPAPPAPAPRPRDDVPSTHLPVPVHWPFSSISLSWETPSAPEEE